MNKQEREAIRDRKYPVMHNVNDAEKHYLSLYRDVTALLDALDEMETRYEELCVEFNKLADGMVTAHKSKELLIDHDHCRKRCEELEKKLRELKSEKSWDIPPIRQEMGS